jgi:hypothetical protein
VPGRSGESTPQVLEELELVLAAGVEPRPAGKTDFLDRLVASLPGLIRRGHAPAIGAASDRLATGWADLDSLLEGGLPRGQLTELVSIGGHKRDGRRPHGPSGFHASSPQRPHTLPIAPASTGATTLAHRLAATVTSSGELVAWIDAADALDPASASETGIDLSRVLWVRPPDRGAGLTAAELVLSAGGFPLVVLDLLSAAAEGRSDAAPDRHQQSRTTARRRRRSDDRDPGQHVWIRLSRAAARSRSALLLLTREGAWETGSCAALRLEVSAAEIRWAAAPTSGAPHLLDGVVARVTVARNRGAHSARELSLHFG